ncbi:6-carboxytetrahydropterin synthase [Photobacterium galatheae]|uniref:6-carboxy-5,6,7,8-tetrahydropterin synthase n=1 Tax=Photobacterium galatheae TaxID=1654360 RepID=A0A066RTV5_9GAMM|nr:6-carboxytetrahydropterin synthase [Photobacterium galatheae]KDM90808.1 hypothetical protein EA58_15595 [Photobacterium galatheae]MCM0149863.1 6-carboxytetrahydropterin synthase [Photobacterium galatheae]
MSSSVSQTGGSSEAMRFTVTKMFDDLPCSHRAWAQQGKCSFLHGYERVFTIEFGCNELEKDTGFVIDFGAMKTIRALLQDQFDHTTVIAENDPELELFQALSEKQIIDLRVMHHPGMEGAAEWVFHNVDALVKRQTNHRVHVLKVEARESRKNAVTFTPQRAQASEASL